MGLQARLFLGMAPAAMVFFQLPCVGAVCGAGWERCRHPLERKRRRGRHKGMHRASSTSRSTNRVCTR